MAVEALTQPLVLYTHPQLPPKLPSLPLYLLARYRKHVAPQNHRWPQQPEQCCDLPATREAKSGRSVRELIPETVSSLMHPKFPRLKRIYLMKKKQHFWEVTVNYLHFLQSTIYPPSLYIFIHYVTVPTFKSASKYRRTKPRSLTAAKATAGSRRSSGCAWITAKPLCFTWQKRHKADKGFSKNKPPSSLKAPEKNQKKALVLVWGGGIWGVKMFWQQRMRMNGEKCHMLYVWINSWWWYPWSRQWWYITWKPIETFDTVKPWKP